jgi:hypothetical protein
VNGDILACPYMNQCGEEWYGGLCRKVNPANFVMGNIFSEDFKRLWNSKKAKELRKTIIISENDFNRRFSDGMDIQQFIRIREQVDFSAGFNYCKVCLFRWGCSC